MSQHAALQRQSLLPPLLSGLIIFAAAGLLWHAAERPIETSALSLESPLQTSDLPSEDHAPMALKFPTAQRGADLTETLARPLFQSTRRPYVAVEVTEEAPAAIAPPAPKSIPPPKFPDGLKLVGIVELADAKPAALLRSESAPEGLKVSTGDELQGWRVSAIGRDTVTLTAGESRRVMSLSDSAR